MRKIVFASLISMATIAPGSAEIKHAFYAGVGLAAVGANHEAAITHFSFNPPALGPNNYQFAKTTSGADIMLGYTAMFRNFVIGAEIDYLFNRFEKTNTSAANANLFDTQKVESTGGVWGLALRLGYSYFDRLQPYIRLGIENRRFKLTASSLFNGPVLPFVRTISSSAHKTAFTPGVGVDFKVTRNFAVGLEYRYAFFSSITKRGFQVIAAPGAGRVTTFKITPRVSTALLSVKYIWG